MLTNHLSKNKSHLLQKKCKQRDDFLHLMETAEPTDEWVERNGKQVCRRCMHEKIEAT